MAKASKRRTIHALVYGPQGSGKSWFLATFGRAYLSGTIPGPLLVLMTDPRGKEAYFKPGPYGGEAPELEMGELDVGGYQVPVTEVKVAGKVACRVEYYHEESLEFGDDFKVQEREGSRLRTMVSGWTVLPKLNKRLYQLIRDEQEEWGTLGIDSVTSLELMVRMYHQFVQDPGARDTRKWWGDTTSELERILCVQLSAWRRNLVVIAHTDRDKATEEAGGGILRYSPRLPGRLSGDIATYYGEMYHALAEAGEYGLETRASKLYNAFSTIIEAPNPCANDYEALWEEHEIR